eukprot:2861888-Prymnesium_polylepis.1
MAAARADGSSHLSLAGTRPPHRSPAVRVRPVPAPGTACAAPCGRCAAPHAVFAAGTQGVRPACIQGVRPPRRMRPAQCTLAATPHGLPLG